VVTVTGDLEQLAKPLGWTIPVELSEVVRRLRESAWPEMVDRWSRLTPTGFPIEFTIRDADPVLRWSAEIAGPEVSDAERLNLVSTYLARTGQAVPIALLDALRSVQRGRDLRFGAWLGGRTTTANKSWLKLYCELPVDTPIDLVPLPLPLSTLVRQMPRGTVPRMMGVEPARNRLELYFRLPTIDPTDLLRLLTTIGDLPALRSLETRLPDGARRLAGRRIGVSLSLDATEQIQTTLFVSARSLFPGSPAMLANLVPSIAGFGDACKSLVAMHLHRVSQDVSFSIGVTSCRHAPSRRDGASIRRPPHE
jgi:hypothetical protein